MFKSCTGLIFTATLPQLNGCIIDTDQILDLGILA